MCCENVSERSSKQATRVRFPLPAMLPVGNIYSGNRINKGSAGVCERAFTLQNRKILSDIDAIICLAP